MTNEFALRSLMAQHCRFALFRLPGENTPRLIAQSSLAADIITDNFTSLNRRKGFVIAPFALSKKTPCVIIRPEHVATGRNEIAQVLSALTKNASPPPETQTGDFPLSHAPAYSPVFEIFHEALAAKQFEKLVLSHPHYAAKAPDFSLTDTFERACQAYPAAFVYVCFTPESGAWLGASPEILINGNHEKWQTVSLAGTQLATENPVWDEKNQQEQRVVTDYIRQTLTNLQLPHHISAPVTVQTGNLMHLKSDISFTLPPEMGIGEVIEHLHPTPAVCGLPKSGAYPFILQHEGYDRAYYTGFVGMLTQNESHLFVNLRCMQIHATYLTLYAGGGLLPSSTCDTEWHEIGAKLHAMQSILNGDFAV